MTGRQQPDMNYCLAMIQLVVSKIFLTIEMTMTGAGKMRQLFSFFSHLLSWWPKQEKCDKFLSSHFHFFGDRSGKKATTVLCTHFHFHDDRRLSYDDRSKKTNQFVAKITSNMRQITASVCACHPKQEDMYECVQLCDSDNRTLFGLNGDRSNFWKFVLFRYLV